MKYPMIEIKGKKYYAKPPKVKAWHDFMSFDSVAADMPVEDYLQKMADLIASVFGSPVTGDMICENLRLDEIRPLFTEILRWLVLLVNNKMDSFPNGEAGQAT